MPKESDRTGKPVPTPQKPILLEDINETPPPPDGAGPEYATDLPGYPADPDFQLRGGYDNLMLDAASQLFGLVIRLRTLDDLAAAMTTAAAGTSCSPTACTFSLRCILDRTHPDTHNLYFGR